MGSKDQTPLDIFESVGICDGAPSNVYCFSHDFKDSIVLHTWAAGGTSTSTAALATHTLSETPLRMILIRANGYSKRIECKYAQSMPYKTP